MHCNKGCRWNYTHTLAFILPSLQIHLPFLPLCLQSNPYHQKIAKEQHERLPPTPPNVLPLAHYLMNEDCVTVIKRTYEGCDTKEALMANEFRDDIIKAVFGDANIGFSAVEEIADEVYYEL